MGNPLNALSPILRKACVLAVIPSTGTFLDHSDYEQAVGLEAPSGLKWAAGEQDGIAVTGASAIRVTDHASLRLTSGTLVCGFQEPPVYHAFNRLFGKRVDATNGFDFYLNGTGSTSLQADITSNRATAWAGTRTLAVGWSAGGVPAFYYDGVSVGAGSLAITTGAGAGNLYLGNNLGAVRPLVSAATGWLAFNRPLTATEFPAVHTLLMSLRTSRGPGSDRRYFDVGDQVPFGPQTIPGRGSVVGAWQLSEVAAAGTVLDRSGHGKDLTRKGNAAPVPSPLGRALRSDGVTGFTDSSSFIHAFVNGCTVRARFVCLGSTGTFQCLVGASSALYFDFSSARQIRYFAAGLTPNTQNSSGYITYGKPHEAVFVHDPAAGKVYEYLDGVQTLEVSGVTGAVLTSQLGVMNGNASALGFRHLNGEMSRADILDYPQTPAEIAASWNAMARRTLYHQDFQDVPDTLANVTAGGIPWTDILVESGEWKVTRDGTRAWLECVAPGEVRIPYDQAYGRSRASFYKAGGGNKIRWMPYALGIAGPGYRVEVDNTEAINLTEVGVVVHGSTAAAYIPVGSWFGLGLDKTAKNAFTGWDQLPGAAWKITDVSGGTGTNPFTDDTTTTSGMMVFDLDAGDRVTDIQHQLGVEV